MTTQTNSSSLEFPAVQADLYRVALALDALLVNGIPYGILVQIASPEFLQQRALALIGDVANLEHHVLRLPDAEQPHARETIRTLAGTCRQLIELLTRLQSFRAFPLAEMHGVVSRIPLLRTECVDMVEQLEREFGTPQPFYQTRPDASTAAVNAFLRDLGRLFEDEWLASNREVGSETT